MLDGAAVPNLAAVLHPRDRVVYFCEGSYAEYVAVPASTVAAVPEALSLDAAVSLTVQGWTAHYLTHSTVPLSAKDDVVVTAAAGGTGKLVVQMARKAGARVLGLVSTNAKAEIAVRCGCDSTLIYRSPRAGSSDDGAIDFSAAVREWSRDGAGASVVYDSVGRSTAAASLASLRPRGTCVFFGNSSGAPAAIEPLTLASHGSLYITRPILNHYLLTPEETAWRAREVFGWAAEGSLTWEVQVGKLKLQDAARAHELLESGTTTGKLLLDLSL